MEAHPEIFLVDLCRAHHTVAGHTKEGRRLLVLLKCELYGSDKVNEALEALRRCYKVPQPELRLEALLWRWALREAGNGRAHNERKTIG